MVLPPFFSLVIPAKAGIQCLCFFFRRTQEQRRWIPAFAGMTS